MYLGIVFVSRWYANCG